MINYLYSTNILYIVNVCTLCIVITIFHIQWMCNPVRIYGNKPNQTKPKSVYGRLYHRSATDCTHQMNGDSTAN